MGSWIDAIEAKARIIHQELQTARALAVRMGQEPDAISGPYLDMLAKLYREDFAYASLADQMASYKGCPPGKAPKKKKGK